MDGWKQGFFWRDKLCERHRSWSWLKNTIATVEFSRVFDAWLIDHSARILRDNTKRTRISQRYLDDRQTLHCSIRTRWGWWFAVSGPGWSTIIDGVMTLYQQIIQIKVKVLAMNWSPTQSGPHRRTTNRRRKKWFCRRMVRTRDILFWNNCDVRPESFDAIRCQSTPLKLWGGKELKPPNRHKHSPYLPLTTALALT